jgi:hypothetical protein
MSRCVSRLGSAGRARSCGGRCASAAVGKLAPRCAHMHSSNPTLGVQCRLTHLTRNERPAQRHRQRAAGWIVGDDLVFVIVWPHLILRLRLAAATTAWAHPPPSATSCRRGHSCAAVGGELTCGVHRGTSSVNWPRQGGGIPAVADRPAPGKRAAFGAGSALVCAALAAARLRLGMRCQRAWPMTICSPGRPLVRSSTRSDPVAETSRN